MILNKENTKELVKGDNTVRMFYKALRLGWQSGVSFGDSRLTSWDLEKKDMWIRPMPKSEDLTMDVINNENIRIANLVKLESLPKEWQEKRLSENDYIEVSGEKLVPNFGFGSLDVGIKGYDGIDFDVWTFTNQDEDDEQDTFTRWILESLPEGTQASNLIALRASESLERHSILKQADYSTGQYAMNILDK